VANDGFSVIRNDLLNPALFGPDGVVPHSIQFVTPVETITPERLAGVEIVLFEVSRTMPGEGELAALEAFVNRGGGLFVFGNDISAFASLVGAVPAPDYNAGSTATVVDAASPLVAGPFGSLPLGPLFSLCFHGTLAAAGPGGRVGITDGVGPFGITYRVGTGRVALLGDEELFLSSYPGFGACIGLGASSRQIFRNAVAFVMPTGVADTGPWISVIPDQTTLEDTPLPDVPFTVGDPDTPLDALVFTVESSNPALIHPTGVVVSGTGSERTLDITPQPDRSGVVDLTLIASDGTSTGQMAFHVTVLPVNDGAPVAGPDTVERLPGRTAKVATSRLLENDTDVDLDLLAVTAVSPVSAHNAAVSWSGSWILYVPSSEMNETDTFTYTVSDHCHPVAV
jgi:hypothetical protein